MSLKYDDNYLSHVATFGPIAKVAAMEWCGESPALRNETTAQFRARH
jgi:hypothetical protein